MRVGTPVLVLDWRGLRRVASDVDKAPEEWRRGFSFVRRSERGDGLVEPKVLAQAGQRISEGGGRLGIPEGTSRRQREPISVLVDVQCDQRVEAEQQWCGAEHRRVRPLPLGLKSK